MNNIKDKITKTKIKKIQLDPFGFCNAKCWFCPVKYFDQPEEGSGSMSIDSMQEILYKIDFEKKQDGVVDQYANFIATSHYNEILLYKDFERMLQLFRKHKYTTMVLSNGVSLNRHKIDIISNYKDVVKHVGLNIPAFEKNLWSSRSGFSDVVFDKLLSNLEYASNKLSYLNSDFKIGINGLNLNQVKEGYVNLGDKFNELGYDLNHEHVNQFKLAKQLFPKIHIEMNYLYDRASSVSDYISNQKYLEKRNKGKKVVGCDNWGDRSIEWLNINSAGNVFLCCNDYNFDYKFGNILEQNLREIWLSELHVSVLTKAYGEICTKCYSAKIQ